MYLKNLLSSKQLAAVELLRTSTDSTAISQEQKVLIRSAIFDLVDLYEKKLDQRVQLLPSADHHCTSIYCKTRPLMLDNTVTYSGGYAFICAACGCMTGCDDDVAR